MSEIREEIIIKEYYRVARFQHIITVDQNTKFDGDLLEAPKIGWASIGAVDIDTARQFQAALARAVEIATEWQADTGRDYREVLK